MSKSQKNTKKAEKQMKITASKLSQQVMAKIQEDKVKVQPKWHFLVGTFLLAFGMLTAAVLAMYLVSLSWYRLEMNSSLNYLWFGRKGQEAFVATFPWLYLLLAVICVVVGWKMLKKFDVSYKFKWQYWMLGLILGLVVAGLGLNKVGVNQGIAKHDMAKPLFVRYGENQDWYKGEVSQVEVKRMMITTMGSDKQMQVKWSEQTRFPSGSEFKKGQWVIMVGDWSGEDFMADGIGAVGEP